MYLLVNVLEETENLTSIIEGFAKVGVMGTTILDSTGMGRVLMASGADAPAMGEITKVLAKGAYTNKTLFAVIKDKDTVQQAIKVIKSFSGDLNKPGKGIIFVLPLEFVEGLKQSD